MSYGRSDIFPLINSGSSCLANEVQDFAYGLLQFQRIFLSKETKADFGAETLLAAVHPPKLNAL